ncbi:MAG: hypothetical protein K8R88_01295 [Armatimonadetes bacterium]|nr:hypothetical protein [Armatimonadota bacterium]
MGDIQVQFGKVESLSAAQFEALWEKTSRVLNAYLRARKFELHTRQDLIQDAFQRIWALRSQIEFKGLPSWFQYCKRTVDHLVIDRARSHGGTLDGQEFLETTPDESPGFEDALARTLELDSIAQVADDLWLGTRPAQHEIKLLAGVLILIDGRRASSVLRLLARESKELPRDVIAILSADRTLNEVLYRGIYLKPNELAARVLGIKPDRLPAVVEAISANQSFEEAGVLWTPDELRIVLRKCCDYDPTSAIRKMNFTKPRVNIDDVIVRISQSLPFMKVVVQIHDAGLALGIPTEPWKESGVWRRLAFQYTMDGLSHLDFQDWFTRPAATVGFEIKPLTLHAWISNKRLAGQLASEIKRRWSLDGDLD